MERGVNEIDAQNPDGFLLEKIGRIEQIDVQQHVVGRAPGLQLKPQAHPAVGLVGSGEVARGDGIHKGEEASLRPAGFA